MSVGSDTLSTMASSRSAPPDTGIILARLDGAARRLLREKTDPDTCVREIHAITTDPQLLGQAAGRALGGWQANGSHDSDRVARMLTAAGADPAVRDQHAAETKARLKAEHRRPGIGNPRPSRRNVSGQ
ncbi:hypothetical protein [Nocardioides sp. SR21]|uniref:hypothetical protein n=1 Tax=Nocardioides sp. SR21 TaxID=2919501 RepID=UPI001FAA784F|nr:hypothetical protein [Nocardioides sp. SR21]